MVSVGFVILTWNSEKYIRACLSTLLAFRTVRVEIAVCDNGSTDRTPEILRSYGDRIRAVYLDKNYGQSISRNIAATRLPVTDYVCILDADTEIRDENGFCRMLHRLDGRGDVGIIAPRLCNAKGETQFSAKHLPTLREKLYKAIPLSYFRRRGDALDHDDYAEKGELFCAPYVISACITLRRDAFLRIGGFDEKIFYGAEDVEYCMRCWERGMKVVYDGSVTVLHHYQRIGRRRFLSKHNYEHLRSLFYLRRKYPSHVFREIERRAEEVP